MTLQQPNDNIKQDTNYNNNPNNDDNSNKINTSVTYSQQILNYSQPKWHSDITDTHFVNPDSSSRTHPSKPWRTYCGVVSTTECLHSLFLRLMAI